MSGILCFYHQDSNQMMGVALLLWASSNRQTTLLYFSTLKTVNSRLFSHTNIITSIAGVKWLSLNACLQKQNKQKKLKSLTVSLNTCC